MKIWLDDIRNPLDHGKDDSWIWILKGEGVIELAKNNLIQEISFDHDLGNESNLTGYDVALVIEELCFNKIIKCPIWHVHSANPIGRKNIEMAMINAERYSNEN